MSEPKRLLTGKQDRTLLLRAMLTFFTQVVSDASRVEHYAQSSGQNGNSAIVEQFALAGRKKCFDNLKQLYCVLIFRLLWSLVRRH